MQRRSAYLVLTIMACLAAATPLVANDSQPMPGGKQDQHYNQLGFFDIHLCNWPKEGVFYLALFSTERFDEIASVEIFYPDDRKLGDLDLARYRLIGADPRRNQREKRVFMANFPKAQDSPDGWYYAVVTHRNGERHVARDLVMHKPIQRASGHSPAPAAEAIPLPNELTWAPIEGAGRYKVFIKDAFLERIIYESELLDAPRLQLPEGLLEKGGAYLWQVHARDVDGHVELGDFNAGSLSDFVGFSIED